MLDVVESHGLRVEDSSPGQKSWDLETYECHLSQDRLHVDGCQQVDQMLHNLHDETHFTSGAGVVMEREKQEKAVTKT